MKPTNDYLFQLYGLVLKGDKSSAQELTELHQKKFPEHKMSWYESYTKEKRLHVFYLHLTAG
jgi:hypothetical protein